MGFGYNETNLIRLGFDHLDFGGRIKILGSSYNLTPIQIDVIENKFRRKIKFPEKSRFKKNLEFLQNIVFQNNVEAPILPPFPLKINTLVDQNIRVSVGRVLENKNTREP